jgi:predicted Ser/Thr protein kinase
VYIYFVNDVGRPCVRCAAVLRSGAAFCSACGEPQPAVVETAVARARYRELLARYLADGALDAGKQLQLDALRIHLGVTMATHATLLTELEPASPPPCVIRLAIDVATLRHLAVGSRGLLRWQIANEGTVALDKVSITAMLAGEQLPTVEATTVFPSHAAVVSMAATPSVPGFHELAGELSVTDLMGEHSRYRFADIHVRAAGDGLQVSVVNIDQSSARVVDNSRSTFALNGNGGIVGEGEWQAVPLLSIREPAAKKLSTSSNPRRSEFAITTTSDVYQVSATLAQGDISTVYGGHARSTQAPVAVKIADSSDNNDLMQHEARVLTTLVGDKHKAAIHLVAVRDQFRTSDGRLGSVFDHLGGFDLTEVRDRCRRRGEPGLPARHVVWVLRRAFAALGLAHSKGILHGNVDPSHILIRPHDHMLWLIDWCWAVVNPAQTGQSFKAKNEIYSPPELAMGGKPTPASDLYSLGKCAIHLAGGDPATKQLPDDWDPRLARFVKFLCVESQGGRGQDAWQLYQQIESVRKLVWGEHTFQILEL